MRLEGFDLGGDDVVNRYILAGRFPALPHAKPSDDVDGTPDFQLIEVLDFFAFPRCYVMPGGFDGLATVLCEVFAFSDDDKFSGFSGVVVLDRNVPEDSDKFDFVQMFHSKNPDGSGRISWHPIDYSSPEFYQTVLDPHIHELNYVVIAVGNDQAGITLAADILRYAIKCGRVDYNNPGNKFRIYVRSYDPDKYAFLHEVTKYYNREGREKEEILINIFGGENDIYTAGMLIDDELETQAKQYADNYNKTSKNVEEEIKKSEENESAKESKQESQTADEKKTDNPYNEPDSPLKRILLMRCIFRRKKK